MTHKHQDYYNDFNEEAMLVQDHETWRKYLANTERKGIRFVLPF